MLFADDFFQVLYLVVSHRYLSGCTEDPKVDVAVCIEGIVKCYTVQNIGDAFGKVYGN